jgi:hypothetical protein
MAEDIRNYLEGKPLLAGPESTIYRARKFVRRNAPRMVAGAIIVLLMTGGLIAYVMRIHAEQRKNTAGQYRLIVRTPVQHVLFDLYLHESLTHWGEPTVRIDSLLEDRPRTEMTAGASAPILAPSDAVRLGVPPRVQSPKYSDHGNLVRWAIERAGWGSLDEFRGYRAEFEYPPPPCEFEVSSAIATGFSAKAQIMAHDSRTSKRAATARER